MSVHYKFKSSVNYDTVTFDGLHISVGDLKKSILQQKKIGKSADFDLQITNAQTKEVFSADDDLVPKNSSVIVARVPVANPVKKTWERSDANTLMQGSESPRHVAFDKLAKTADLVNANATEEEKIKAMMTQSAHEYDPSKYVKSRSMTGPLPANYICYRCGKSGHWIKNCPTNNAEIKRSTGIPRSFMVTVDGPDIKGALLTSSGDFAVPLIDQQAYKEVKKEKPPFLKEAEAPPEPEPSLPEDLLCMHCRDLLQDAVLIPCCGNSFCDECARQVLLDSENHECPVCHETNVSPDTLIPNRFQRNAVRSFKNETGYIRNRKPPAPAISTADTSASSISAPPPSTSAPSTVSAPPPSTSAPSTVSAPPPSTSAPSTSATFSSATTALATFSSATTVSAPSSSVTTASAPSSSVTTASAPSSSAATALAPSASATITSDTSGLFSTISTDVTLAIPSLATLTSSLVSDTQLANSSPPPSFPNASAPSVSVPVVSAPPVQDLVPDEQSRNTPDLEDIKVDQRQPASTASEHTLLENLVISENVEVSALLPKIPSEDVGHVSSKSEVNVEGHADSDSMDAKIDDLNTNDDDEGKTSIAECDARAATPLADEPPADFKERHEDDSQHAHQPRSRDGYDSRSSHNRHGYNSPPSESEPSTISTITTRGPGSDWGRKPFWNKYPNQPYEPSSHRESRDTREYGSNYRHSSDYHHRSYNSHRNYPMGSSSSYRYPPRLPSRGSARGSSRSYMRYQSPPPPASRYTSPPPNVQSQRSSHLLPAPTVLQPPATSAVRHPDPAPYHTEPPPPGTDARSQPPARSEAPPHHAAVDGSAGPTAHRETSSVSHREPRLADGPAGHHEPPPPGVGPLLPLPPPTASVSNQPVPATSVPTTLAATTSSSQLAPTYPDNYSRHLDVYRQSNTYHNRRPKDKKWSKDPMEDFERELLEFKRERPPRTSRRSRSHSYHSSKSWSHSRSRSYSHSISRSRSRSPTYSSRSRSRSFSRSRSRSPIRIFSRSRSRSRSMHSGSRSPRRKYRSPPRYFRSRSRSPPKHFRGTTKSYSKRSEMHSPSYYNQSSYVSSYSQSTSQPSAPVDQYGSDRAYYDSYHASYDGYPSHSERRYNSSIPPPDTRYIQHADKYVDPRKYHSRIYDRRVMIRKDDRLGRIDMPMSYGTEKYKEPPAEVPAYLPRKEEKVKEESRSYHKYRESKKSSELPTKTKEIKFKSDANTETVQVVIKTDAKPKRSSKSEKTGKEHKHKHKKVKEGEEHKRKKKKKSSDDTSQVTGSESDKPKKKKKTKKSVDKMKEISEVPETTEATPSLLDSPGSKNILEEAAVSMIEPVLTEIDKDGLQYPEADEGGDVDVQTPEPEDRSEKIEDADDMNESVEKEEPPSEGDQVVIGEFTDIKDEASVQNESFSSEEVPPASGDESDAQEAANDSVLKVELPELSKWERDDSDEPESEEEPSSPASKKGDVDEGIKTSLTSDIIQKAENAILQKAAKLLPVGEIPVSRAKSSVHTDKPQEPKVTETLEVKTEDVIDKSTKTEKRDAGTKSSESDSPQKRDDSHTTIINFKRDAERRERDQNVRDKVVTESRTVRMVSRDRERERPGSRNSSGSRHSSGSRNQHRSSRHHFEHRRSRDRHLHDMRREIRVREGSRSSSNRAASGSSRKQIDPSEVSISVDLKSTRQRKMSTNHQHDESNFEPNYDETSDSDVSRGSNHDHPKIVKRRVSIKNEPLPVKHRSSRTSHSEHQGSKSSEYERSHSRSNPERRSTPLERHKSSGDSDSPSDSASKKRKTNEPAPKESKRLKSESVSSSSSESESDEETKKKIRSESSDPEQKHQKRVKHKKHKKHKHKKRKSSRRKREEVRVMSSVVRR